MLAAAEVSMDAAAEDDAARERNRARLYAPPARERRRTDRQQPARTGMSLDDVRAMMANVAQEDAQLTRRRSG
ncbi:hypothetical protein H114_32824 [Streptomyces gancidicus BKS 13-15]|uniref:Uncharacterized protein n=1 Tax=Streptomyces gancidicus BKS 13-15 TaxID=1284664 RepID=M3DGB5_STREZ|nr:hypothetical protein [Streptomyces gancidicus]EMF20426.1 hypothetical protein H114_32824 [Streptomyces gancidicus BKS 13-15]